MTLRRMHNRCSEAQDRSKPHSDPGREQEQFTQPRTCVLRLRIVPQPLPGTSMAVARSTNCTCTQHCPCMWHFADSAPQRTNRHCMRKTRGTLVHTLALMQPRGRLVPVHVHAAGPLCVGSFLLMIRGARASGAWPLSTSPGGPTNIQSRIMMPSMTDLTLPARTGL